MKQSRLETKLDLMAIIDAAFYEYDDYVSECHEKDIDPHEGVEAFVADAIIEAGYRKVETDNNVGGKTDTSNEINKMRSALSEECKKHDDCDLCPYTNGYCNTYAIASAPDHIVVKWYETVFNTKEGE